MDGDHAIGAIAVFAVLILAEIVLYGFISAREALNEGELERRAQEGEEKAKKLLNLLGKSELFQIAVHAALTSCGLAAGAYLLRTAVSWGRKLWGAQPSFWQEALVACGAVVLLLLLLLLLGFYLPKKLASRNPESWASAVQGPAAFLAWFFYPAAWAVRALGRVVLRLFGIDPDEDTGKVTEEEIMSMVNEGHEKGVLQASEAEMITNIFELDDKEASDIMTHRTSVKALDGHMKLEEAVKVILTENNSRFPVFHEDIDDIIGVLHLKDAVIAMEKQENRQKELAEVPGLLREADFIPETRNISNLFKSMQSKKTQMVIVVDEYGQTAGIITMEDILEEIVGSIMDEYDVDEIHIRSDGPGAWTAEGSAELEEVEEAAGVRFDEEEIETLNGFLVAQLDRIPQEGEQPEIVYGGYRFQVLQVENNMIQTIKIIRETEKEENSPLQD